MALDAAERLQAGARLSQGSDASGPFMPRTASCWQSPAPTSAAEAAGALRGYSATGDGRFKRPHRGWPDQQAGWAAASVRPAWPARHRPADCEGVAPTGYPLAVGQKRADLRVVREGLVRAAHNGPGPLQIERNVAAEGRARCQRDPCHARSSQCGVGYAATLRARSRRLTGPDQLSHCPVNLGGLATQRSARRPHETHCSGRHAAPPAASMMNA